MPLVGTITATSGSAGSPSIRRAPPPSIDTVGRARCRSACASRSGRRWSIGRRAAPEPQISATRSNHAGAGSHETATTSPELTETCSRAGTSARLAQTVRVFALGVRSHDVRHPGPAAGRGPATYTDIRYETAEGIAKITIDRPEVRNAFRPLTVRELIRAFDVARDDPEIGVVVLTGQGTEAFCSGGDQKVRGDDGYVDEHGIGRLNVLDLQIQIRRLPKPVVAMVAGYAIGGGHVLHVCCDLTIAADNARFGQIRAAGGVVRRRVRDQPTRASDRREAREGGLVPLPPVRRARPRSRGGWSTPSCRSNSSNARPCPGAARCCG